MTVHAIPVVFYIDGGSTREEAAAGLARELDALGMVGDIVMGDGLEIESWVMPNDPDADKSDIEGPTLVYTSPNYPRTAEAVEIDSYAAAYGWARAILEDLEAPDGSHPFMEAVATVNAKARSR